MRFLTALIRGLYEEAVPLLERALEIRERVLGPQHPRVASICNNLALTWVDQGRSEDAIDLLRSAGHQTEATEIEGQEDPGVIVTLLGRSRQ